MAEPEALRKLAAQRSLIATDKSQFTLQSGIQRVVSVMKPQFAPQRGVKRVAGGKRRGFGAARPRTKKQEQEALEGRQNSLPIWGLPPRLV